MTEDWKQRVNLRNKQAHPMKRKAVLNSKDNQKKQMLLQELMIDLDWSAAAKRCGISRKKLVQYKADKKFMEKAEQAISGAQGEEVSRAKNNLRKVQKILMDALEEGELKAAKDAIKTIEMEYKYLGLFAKDNEQKANSDVVFNIGFYGGKPKEEKVIDAEELSQGIRQLSQQASTEEEEGIEEQST